MMSDPNLNELNSGVPSSSVPQGQHSIDNAVREREDTAADHISLFEPLNDAMTVEYGFSELDLMKLLE